MQNVRGDSSAHWPALLAADFFTTDVCTHRGLLTYYTAFALELHSRRVSRAGHDDAPGQRLRDEALRGLAGDSDILRAGRFLICDRDPKWSGAVVSFLEGEGVRVIRTPARAPNCNAYAERFVRSITEECLDRLLVLGERHLRRASGSSSRIATANGIATASGTS